MATRGHEMRRFLTWASVMVVLLIIAIVAYNIADASVTLNHQEKQAEEQVINEAKNIVDLSIEEIYNPGGSVGEASNAFLQYFNPQIVQSYLTGDPKPVYGLMIDVLLPLYGIDTAVIVSNGQVVGSRLPEGVNPQDFPTPQPDEQSRIVDSFAGRQGHFLVWFVPLQVSITGETAEITAVIDRTDEINRIASDFSQARRNLILRQILVGIAAIIISLLIILVGLRLLARKYITGPINQLSTAADGIMDGTFKGDVEVNPESDYSSIQSLLQSGQAIISRIDREMEGNPDA